MGERDDREQLLHASALARALRVSPRTAAARLDLWERVYGPPVVQRDARGRGLARRYLALAREGRLVASLPSAGAADGPQGPLVPPDAPAPGVAPPQGLGGVARRPVQLAAPQDGSPLPADRTVASLAAEVEVLRRQIREITRILRFRGIMRPEAADE